MCQRKEGAAPCATPAHHLSFPAPVSVHHLSSGFGSFFRRCHWLLQLERDSSTWNPSTTRRQISTCAGTVQQCSLSMRSTVGQCTLAAGLPAIATFCGAMQARWASTHLVLSSFLVDTYEVKGNCKACGIACELFQHPTGFRYCPLFWMHGASQEGIVLILHSV
jgi:hypothetical protein